VPPDPRIGGSRGCRGLGFFLFAPCWLSPLVLLKLSRIFHPLLSSFGLGPRFGIKQFVILVTRSSPFSQIFDPAPVPTILAGSPSELKDFPPLHRFRCSVFPSFGGLFCCFFLSFLSHVLCQPLSSRSLGGCSLFRDIVCPLAGPFDSQGLSSHSHPSCKTFNPVPQKPLSSIPAKQLG